MIIVALASFAIACTQTHSPEVTQTTSGKKIILNGGQTGQIRHFKAALNNSNRTSKVVLFNLVTSNTYTHSPEVTQTTSGKQVVLIGGTAGYWNRKSTIQSVDIPIITGTRNTQIAREFLVSGGTSANVRLTQEAREVLTHPPYTGPRLTQLSREYIVAQPEVHAAQVNESQAVFEFAHDVPVDVHHTQDALEYVWELPNTTIESQLVLEVAFHHETPPAPTGVYLTQIAVERLVSNPTGTETLSERGRNIMVYHIG